MTRFFVYIIPATITALIVSCGEARFSSDRDTTQVKASDVVDDDTTRTPLEQQIIDDAVRNNICDAGGKKVRICHFPPGNIANRHTICIGMPALKAHVGRHGDGDDFDYVGACDGGANPPPGSGDDDDGDDDDDDDDDDGPPPGTDPPSPPSEPGPGPEPEPGPIET